MKETSITYMFCYELQDHKPWCVITPGMMEGVISCWVVSSRHATREEAINEQNNVQQDD